MMFTFNKARILIIGGTGSLGEAVLNEILTEKHGIPSRIRIMSRDETKHYELKKKLGSKKPYVEFRIGDIRCYESVVSSILNMDYVINAAALKHVPICETHPIEAVKTNIIGVDNIVRAIKEHNLNVDTVIGISTDKACAPASIMGMTKAIHERILMIANNGKTRFIGIRFGNMLKSRGSVIPLFEEQIKNGGPITITHPQMIRFFIPLQSAASHLINAIRSTPPGMIYIPQMKAAFVKEIAEVMTQGTKIKINYTGIRPGEKLEDVIISKEESRYVCRNLGYFLMGSPINEAHESNKTFEYSSGLPEVRMTKDEIRKVLREAK